MTSIKRTILAIGLILALIVAGFAVVYVRQPVFRGTGTLTDRGLLGYPRYEIAFPTHVVDTPEFEFRETLSGAPSEELWIQLSWKPLVPPSVAKTPTEASQRLIDEPDFGGGTLEIEIRDAANGEVIVSARGPVFVGSYDAPGHEADWVISTGGFPLRTSFWNRTVPRLGFQSSAEYEFVIRGEDLPVTAFGSYSLQISGGGFETP